MHPATLGYARIAESSLGATKTNNPGAKVQSVSTDKSAVLAASTLPVLWDEPSTALERGAWLWDTVLKASG